jgi:hypothetical protein
MGRLWGGYESHQIFPANNKGLAGNSGGWGGIRTHGDVAATPVFKTGALNRSATHPDRCATGKARDGPHVQRKGGRGQHRYPVSKGGYPEREIAGTTLRMWAAVRRKTERSTPCPAEARGPYSRCQKSTRPLGTMPTNSGSAWYGNIEGTIQGPWCVGPATEGGASIASGGWGR